jgi:Cu-Zn family superoxide dismutase
LSLAACGQPAEEQQVEEELPPAAGASMGAAPQAAMAADLYAAQAGAAADLRNAQGATIGRAEMIQTPAGLLVRLRVEGLTPGWHGVHLHTTGSCAAPGFQSAGGHVHDGAAGAHGLRNPAGPEQGDLPNLFVGSDGRGAAEFYSTLARLSGARVNLLDPDGSAILVHAGADDHATQPIGGSGDRVACGVIVASGANAGGQTATTAPTAGAPAVPQGTAVTPAPPASPAPGGTAPAAGAAAPVAAATSPPQPAAPARTPSTTATPRP